MTLQALREEIGDATLFAVLRGWEAVKSGGNATTEEFIAFAERLAGRDLAELFDTWLYTPERPALAPAAVTLSQGARQQGARWLAHARERHAHLHAARESRPSAAARRAALGGWPRRRRAPASPGAR